MWPRGRDAFLASIRQLRDEGVAGPDRPDQNQVNAPAVARIFIVEAAAGRSRFALLMLRASRFLFLLSVLHALARAETADADAVLQGDPLVVQERLLTGSAATVTRFDLAAQPQLQLSTANIADRAANFFVADGGARSFTDIFALRGLTNTPLFGDPAVSVYLDDLPLGSGFTFPSALAGFTRAELHRGPGQNTVFGRAGPAGVLTLTTPAPGGSASGDARGSYGNYHSRGAAVHASTARGGAADAYVSAAWAARDGYITNTTLNRDIDRKDATSALARLRLRPTDTSELTLLVTALRAHDGVQPLVPLGGPLDTVTRSAEGYTDVDAINAALKVSFATSIGQLSATTSVSDWQLGPYLSTLDFGFAELSNQVSQQQRNWSEELKLVSSEAATVRWQAGAFFADSRTDGTFRRAFGPFVFENSTYQVDARSLAGFGEITWDVGASLAVTAGIRAEGSRKQLDRRELAPVPQRFALTRESTALLPKLAARYTLDPDTSVFASVGAGYKPGGFSAFTGNAALAGFGPERTRALEAGATRATADRAFSATVRAFWYDVSGYQIERSFATGGMADDYLVVNAPRARSFGGELEFAWRPLPGLTLAADLGATDVTLREFRDPYSGERYDGRRAPAVPMHDMSLRASYEHRGGFFAGAEFNTVGRTYYTEGEELSFGQRSYGLFSAQLGYASGRYRVSVYGANLGDEAYYSSITPGTGHGTPGAPRTYGVEVSVTW